MSLFKAREWWTCSVGEDEEFDQGCLCVANIDNSTGGADKIIVGSFHGIVRIYNPKPVKTENGWTGFKPEDVLCETQLSAPVLQVAAGIFISGSDNIQLAVLHPRKLAVYSVLGSSGAVGHGTHHQIKLVYEHNLQRAAFNFCYGPFGGVKDRDFICVQSMDGTVSVYEQESFAFSRFLPGALLPGPIVYVPKTDSFITVSSNRHVESYKYQVLAVASDAKSKEESQNVKSGKKVACEWSFNIGEQAVDISVPSFPLTSPCIMILGERSLFCLSEVGKLKFMKKFDFPPSGFVPYASMIEGTIHWLVTSHNKNVLIFQDVSLKWAAHLNYVPVQTKVANFQDLKGVLVSLDESGHLECHFLGTDPALFRPLTSEVREIDYAQQDREMQMLQKIIKQQQGKSAVPLPAARKDDDLLLSTEVPHSLDERALSEDTEIHDGELVPSITVKIQLKAKIPVSNIKLSIHVAPPLYASDSFTTFHSIDPSMPAECRCVFYMRQNFLPADQSVNITATYQTSSGAPRVVQTMCRLPLKLVVRPCLPVKSANYKLTIDTNKPPVNFNEIFPDLLGDNSGGAGNALGFQIVGGPVVSLLASKSSQRYRLQSDQFEAMWPVLNEFCGRLNSSFRTKKQTDFKISYEGSLPLQEYFEVLDKHFDFRLNEDKYKEMLGERASQFRAVQRRLLTRFKDKTPAPLSNLDTLLDGTYRQLLALAEASDENRNAQLGQGAALSCATRLLNKLIQLWSDMTDSEFVILQGALSPVIADNGEHGWEEMVDAAITHLLRTCLAKSAKDQTVNPTPLALMKDTGKLKKHIALLCDRLSKGARLNVEGQGEQVYDPRPGPPPASRKAAIAEDDDLDLSPSGRFDLGTSEVPIGSKYGENKSPRRDKTLAPISGVNKSNQLAPLRNPNNEINGVSTPSDRSFLKTSPEPHDSRSSPDHEALTSSVPDLDAIDSDEEDQGLFSNGEGDELVYGL